MGAVDLRDVDWVLTNSITDSDREPYLYSTTKVPTRDWLLNLQILTSRGFR